MARSPLPRCGCCRWLTDPFPVFGSRLLACLLGRTGSNTLIAFKYLSVLVQEMAIEVDESLIVRLVRAPKRCGWARHTKSPLAWP